MGTALSPGASPLFPLHVIVSRLPATRIAYLHYQGPFGTALGRFWRDEVYPWIIVSNLLGRPRYGIGYGDREEMVDAACRYDAGVEVEQGYIPSRGAKIREMPGGLYASTRFRGGASEVPLLWDRFVYEWLPSSGYQLDERPCFEYYPLDAEFDPKSGMFTCDLCAPIRLIEA